MMLTTEDRDVGYLRLREFEGDPSLVIPAPPRPWAEMRPLRGWTAASFARFCALLALTFLACAALAGAVAWIGARLWWGGRAWTP